MKKSEKKWKKSEKSNKKWKKSDALVKKVTSGKNVKKVNKIKGENNKKEKKVTKKV